MNCILLFIVPEKKPPIVKLFDHVRKDLNSHFFLVKWFIPYRHRLLLPDAFHDMIEVPKAGIFLTFIQHYDWISCWQLPLLPVTYVVKLSGNLLNALKTLKPTI